MIHFTCNTLSDILFYFVGIYRAGVNLHLLTNPSREFKNGCKYFKNNDGQTTAIKKLRTAITNTIRLQLSANVCRHIKNITCVLHFESQVSSKSYIWSKSARCHTLASIEGKAQLRVLEKIMQTFVSNQISVCFIFITVEARVC